MTIKPWREIAIPHNDVLQGSFQQSEFAADITQVAQGRAHPEYQDARQFFARTFITEGMRLLLTAVARRLCGLGGEPVIQLQTAFGGGKTHTMLAVYHLANHHDRTQQLEGIPTLLDQAGISDLPRARVAVLDGINLSVSRGKAHGDITAHTLWGELAWQLAGADGYALVDAEDKSGTAPGKDTLIALLQQAAPCVVLIDELQKYFSDLSQEGLPAGSFAANIKFIQALTEAFKAVPTAVLLASLPASLLKGGAGFGQVALDALEKHFNRVNAVWKPAAAEEAFEIIRRRLFEKTGERAEIEQVCRAFQKLYNEHDGDFPPECQSAQYLDRLCRSYPIHPEIFDRLYHTWSTLDNFQRTRGVLQYLAIVIHRLWVNNNQDGLILPGSLPLEDGEVQNKSIQYLPGGWEAIMTREVAGKPSIPYHIDGGKKEDSRFGAVQAAQRVMCTIFLATAPEDGRQNVRGIDTAHILLGTVQPGQNVGIFKDVLKRLQDSLHYLYTDQDRYWLDTKPSLRREAEGRKSNFTMADLRDEQKKRVQDTLAKGRYFAHIHYFAPSADIPDDWLLRLVVLPPEAGYSRSEKETAAAFKAAAEILEKRGEQARQKRNRLLFFAIDGDTKARLDDATRTYLAWKSINHDIDEEKLNLDTNQVKQARRSRTGAEESLKLVIRDAYKWLIIPEQYDAAPPVQWAAKAVSANAAKLIEEIENVALNEEAITREWAPIHLRDILHKYYFKDGLNEISALKVYHDCCQYLYLPRLVNDGVYKNTLREALKSTDYFGFADGKDGDKYLGFCFGKDNFNLLMEQSLLITQETAAAYQARITATPTPPPASIAARNKTTSTPVSGGNAANHDNNPPQAANRTHFFARAELNPLKAKMEFGNIFDEIIAQFSEKSGVTVHLSIEIDATATEGFDENLQRSVNENSKVLKVQGEFE